MDNDCMLAALQLGIPLEPRPFRAVARRLGATEDEAIDFVRSLRERGVVRRFGGVFDNRRLGWDSVLCAVDAGPDIERLAAAVTPLANVTHCYERVPSPELPGFTRRDLAPAKRPPDLWFTFAAPTTRFDAELASLRAALAPRAVHALPALVRYKVDVVFGAASRAREESVDPGGELTDADLAVVRALQGDTDVRPDYFNAIASAAGLSEWRLLATLEMWIRSGRLKRIGLLLRHRDAGWTHNAMCCWRVPAGERDYGRALAASPHVTHCYERPLAEAFPYNLFAMIHCRSAAQAESEFAELDASLRRPGFAPPPPGVMLVSRTEFKKSSLVV